MVDESLGLGSCVWSLKHDERCVISGLCTINMHQSACWIDFGIHTYLLESCGIVKIIRALHYLLSLWSIQTLDYQYEIRIVLLLTKMRSYLYF